MTFPIQDPRSLTVEETKKLLHTLPNLYSGWTWVLGPENPLYNCIAWTLGITTNWIEPPKGKPRDRAALNKLYGQYRDTPQYDTYASGIAIYGKDAINIAHASVKLDVRSRELGERWTSKLGKSFLVTHHLADLTGAASSYGWVYGFYRQVYGGRPVTTQLTRPEVNLKYDEEGMAVLDPELVPPYEFGDAHDEVMRRAAATPATMQEAFSAAWDDWRRTWDEPPLVFSSFAADSTKSIQFERLVRLGREILPLLMRELLSAENFFALQAVERLLPADQIFSPEISDREYFGGEQYRAFQTVLRWVEGSEWRTSSMTPEPRPLLDFAIANHACREGIEWVRDTRIELAEAWREGRRRGAERHPEFYVWIAALHAGSPGWAEGYLVGETALEFANAIGEDASPVLDDLTRLIKDGLAKTPTDPRIENWAIRAAGLAAETAREKNNVAAISSMHEAALARLTHGALKG